MHIFKFLYGFILAISLFSIGTLTYAYECPAPGATGLTTWYAYPSGKPVTAVPANAVFNYIMNITVGVVCTYGSPNLQIMMPGSFTASDTSMWANDFGTPVCGPNPPSGTVNPQGKSIAQCAFN